MTERVPMSREMRRDQLLRACVALAIALASPCPARAQAPRELYSEWKAKRVTTLDPALVRHADLLKYLERVRALGVPVAEVGRSLAGREIYQMEFGRGPLKVFMWSQMHGDEPTATSALIDLFAYLQTNRERPWARRIAEKVTLRGVPMLNPDGAEVWQRRNLQGIDINRDALALSTPEGRLLKKLRDEWRPDVGFNLHNQNPRYAVGQTRRQAALSLLAVPADEARTDTPGRVRNKKLCAVMVAALAPFVEGHIGRYDDTFNPRAFGDNISRWGTPVILIETGGLKGMTGHELAGLNFVALAAALRALTDGSYEQADPAVYDRLPENESGTIFDLVVRGGTIVTPARDGAARVEPYAADLAVNVEAGRGGGGPRRAGLQDVGDLSVYRGLEEVDAAGYYVVAAGGARPGAEATLLFYPKERAAGVAWDAADLETRHPPEAVFRRGEWVRRGRLPVR
jgi:hypothetical protein